MSVKNTIVPFTGLNEGVGMVVVTCSSTVSTGNARDASDSSNAGVNVFEFASQSTYGMSTVTEAYVVEFVVFHCASGGGLGGGGGGGLGHAPYTAHDTE